MTKALWNDIYNTKASDHLSWYQSHYDFSLQLIKSTIEQRNRPIQETSVIDVGAGSSNLVDSLIELGFGRIALLDISESALEISKKRLNEKSANLSWIVGDITSIEKLDKSFDIWHDRAVFHFLMTEKDQKHYVNLAKNSIQMNGYLILGTFALDGPTSCSGLPVCQYDEEKLLKLFNDGWKLIKSVKNQHITPSGTSQSFLFVVLQRA